MALLYLGSKSSSRRMLLDQAQIPYTVAEMDADETQCDWGQTLQKVVESIALYKMQQVIIPPGNKEGQICFVLTGDTLSVDARGQIGGKPVDRADAIEKIKQARDGMRTGTAFCLEKRQWIQGVWKTIAHKLCFVDAQYEFIVPYDDIETYLDRSVGMKGTQAIAVEEYGAQFLKVVQGSYTAIVGLPMFELRQALQEFGFFSDYE